MRQQKEVESYPHPIHYHISAIVQSLEDVLLKTLGNLELRAPFLDQSMVQKLKDLPSDREGLKQPPYSVYTKHRLLQKIELREKGEKSNPYFLLNRLDIIMAF